MADDPAPQPQPPGAPASPPSPVALEPRVRAELNPPLLELLVVELGALPPVLLPPLALEALLVELLVPAALLVMAALPVLATLLEALDPELPLLLPVWAQLPPWQA